MGIIRQAFLSFLKNSSLYVTMVIEITIIILGINALVSGMENQKMLFRPYESMLRGQGCAFSIDMRKYLEYEDVEDYYTEVDDTITHLKEAEVFEFGIEFFSCGGNNIQVVLYDDSKVPIKLPLQSGTWAKEKHEGVASPDFAGRNGGGSITLDGTEIKISGILTDPTYCPYFGDWWEFMDVTGFYRRYAEGDKEMTPFIILPKSVFSEKEDQAFLEKFYQSRSIVLISYSDNCTDKIREENEKVLSELGYIMPFSDLYENSIRKQEDILENARPLFIVGILISIIGFISNKAIRMKNFQNELYIYSLCGADKKAINKICLCQDAVMLAVSTLFATFLLVLLKKYGVGINLGLLLSAKNLLWTLAICCFYMLISVIINIIFVWRINGDRA